MTMTRPRTARSRHAARPDRAATRSAIGRTLRLVGPDVRPHRRLVAGGTLALLLEVVVRILEPWPMKIVVDSVVTSMGTPTGVGAATVRTLLVCGAALIGLVAMRAVCNYLATVAFALTGSRAAVSLRARAFAHVQGLSQQFHARNRSADTVQRLVADVARMQEVATTAGLPLVANVMTLVAMLVVMVVIDPLLATVVVAAVVLFLGTSTGTSKRITAASRRTRKGEAQLANTAQEALGAIKVVQAYGLEPLLQERFTGANNRSLKEGVRSRRLAARLERGTDLIVGVATAAVMVGGGLRVLQGDMTPGELVLFTTYLRTTMKPLRDMAKYTGRVARASASGERVADLMDTVPEIVSPSNPMRPVKVWGRIRFHRVSAAYEGTEVLHDVDLTVHPGEHVAFIGPSGSGKSTLVSMVVRAMDPVHGSITLDGRPLTALDLGWLRAQVSVLHQEAVLFTGTIRDNIRLGRESATAQEIEAAARAANAHEFIISLPDGYDTLVGERGGTLSGGQRQRVAIARALLRDSPIIVLDEATTGLDPASTGLVLDGVGHLVAGRTTLTVTHDAEVALRATRVVWVEDGRVHDDDAPHVLMARSERFRTWVRTGGSQAAVARMSRTSA